jgi:hypothetical protein
VTLQEATRSLLAAIESGDLDAIALALEARGRVIWDGAIASPEDVEEGERACRALAALKQTWAFDSARLGHIQSLFSSPADPHIDLRG